jgi:hypothetical protein
LARDVRINCPKCPERGHPPDRKKKLYLNPTKRVGHCFRCGFKVGPDAFESFTQTLGFVYTPSLGAALDPVPETTLPAGFSTAWRTPYGTVVWRYLRQRHLDPATIVGYNLGYCAGGPYANRVVLPVYQGGELQTWQARDLTGKSPAKYVSAPGSKPHRLFNLDRASRSPVRVLVEGQFDALRLPDFAIGLLGKEWHPAKRAQLLASRPKLVLVALDRDGTADRNAHDIAYDLHGLVRVEALPIHGKDLGSLPAANVAKLDTLLRKAAALLGPGPG